MARGTGAGAGVVRPMFSGSRAPGFRAQPHRIGGSHASLLQGHFAADPCGRTSFPLVEAEELSDFVLVGHSYGGFVISGVADALRERVSRYVYLDGSVPPDMSSGASFSWAGFNPPEAREARLKSVREQGKGVALPAPPPSAFAVTQPADVAWLQRRMRPMPVGTYIGTFTFKNSGSNGLKRTYIASTKPPYALLASTRNSIRGDPTWSFTTIEAGHDSMVTAPDELASRLMAA